VVTRLLKRARSFGRELDILLDRFGMAIAELQLAASRGVAEETVLNDSGSTTRRYLLYGRDLAVGDGKIALASAGAAPVEPFFVALASVGIGDELPISRGGRNRLLLEDPGDMIARGGWVWLSQTRPGRVTPTIPPTGRRWRVGHFASSIVNADGSADCWLTIFPQSGGVL